MRRTRTALVAGVAAIIVVAAVPVALAALQSAPAAPAAPGSPNDCVRAQLNVRSNGSDGAAGTIHGAWVFTNRSNDACILDGYPDLQLYGRGGRPLPTTVKKDLPPSPAQVSLDPGDSATFLSRYSDVPSGTQRCRPSAVLAITAPNSDAGLFIPASLEACGGIVHVSAVEAGVHGP
jgi:hypothetical protein